MTLVKFIEGHHASVTDDYIYRQPKVVCAVDAVVGNDEWIGKQHDATLPVRIIYQQSLTVRTKEVKDRSRRSKRRILAHWFTVDFLVVFRFGLG